MLYSIHAYGSTVATVYAYCRQSLHILKLNYSYMHNAKTLYQPLAIQLIILSSIIGYDTRVTHSLLIVIAGRSLAAKYADIVANYS